MKFIKPFKGAVGGNPYPQEFAEGDECPDELVAAATELGVLPNETGLAPQPPAPQPHAPKITVK